MATTVNLTCNKIGYVRADAKDTQYSVSWGNDYVLGKKGKDKLYYRMYFGFPALADEYKYYTISSTYVYVCVKGDYSTGFYLYRALDFNANTITYNTKPSTSSSWIENEYLEEPETTYRNIAMDGTNYDEPVKFLKNRAFCITASFPDSNTYAPYIKTSLKDGTTKPYVKVTLGSKNYSYPLYKAGPKGGAYSNPRNAIKFQWENRAKYDVAETYAGNIPQTSAVFYWKTSSEGSYHSVNVSGSTTAVTIPANTFPTASTIQWYVKTTDAGGTSKSTDVFSFSTTAATMVATVVSPINSIEENNAPITLKWRLSSSDGFPASRVALYWKEHSASEWTSLYDVSEAITSYTVPANTFPVGEIDWYVRGWNVDDVQGTGSSATFVSFGAPDAPVVDSDQAPFATITWQADNQQAYELEIAGKKYGPYFGSDKSFTLVDYLEDGTYHVRVRIMGDYRQWSLWGETELYIENIPGQDVVLSAKVWIESELSWNTEDETADFLIYRNGKQIGHTTKSAFIDMLANGETEYYVVNRLSDGNYTKSNVIQRTIKPEFLYIKGVEDTDWIAVRYTLNGTSDPQYYDNITVTYSPISGKAYQQVFASEFYDTTIGYSAVFLYTEKEALERFKKLFGKPVMAKFPDGWAGVCFINSWQHYPKKGYYTAYTFTLKQIDWEDYVDEN